MKCDYCNQEFHEYRDEYCRCCGAAKPKIFKSEPFFYEGFIVWILRTDFGDARQFIFYSGMTFVAEVWLGYDEYIKFCGTAIDPMPYVFEKLKSQNNPVLQYSQNQALTV